MKLAPELVRLQTLLDYNLQPLQDATEMLDNVADKQIDMQVAPAEIATQAQVEAWLALLALRGFFQWLFSGARFES